MRSLLKLSSTTLFSLSLALGMIAVAARETQAAPVLFCPGYPCPFVKCGLFGRGNCMTHFIVNPDTNEVTYWCSCD